MKNNIDVNAFVVFMISNADSKHKVDFVNDSYRQWNERNNKDTRHVAR